MSKEIKKGNINPSPKPSNPKPPIEVPSLRERSEKATNQGGDARKPVMTTPIPTPKKKD